MINPIVSVTALVQAVNELERFASSGGVSELTQSAAALVAKEMRARMRETPVETGLKAEWAEAFDMVFWADYSRLRASGKAVAKRSWMKLFSPSRESLQRLLDEIMAGLKLHWRILEAREREKRPHASTWLNQRRWEDPEP